MDNAAALAGCCSLSPDHDGFCIWVCPDCGGSGRCSECSVECYCDDVVQCDYCDGSEACPECDGDGTLLE